MGFKSALNYTYTILASNYIINYKTYQSQCMPEILNRVCIMYFV